uniref:Uncharacterized protein n=1 Tax=Opuntia streptacantha TaxID=393608 RepID=A0A7C9FRA9_OPUST
MAWTFPVHSTLRSTPPLVISTITSCTGLLWSLGLTNSVTPNFFAGSNLLETRSTPIILDAPETLAPSAAARPTAPRPKIATVWPFFGFATFTVAPKPVENPQLMMQTLSRGASGLILARHPM